MPLHNNNNNSEAQPCFVLLRAHERRLSSSCAQHGNTPPHLRATLPFLFSESSRAACGTAVRAKNDGEFLIEWGVGLSVGVNNGLVHFPPRAHVIA